MIRVNFRPSCCLWQLKNRLISLIFHVVRQCLNDQGFNVVCMYGTVWETINIICIAPAFSKLSSVWKLSVS